MQATVCKWKSNRLPLPIMKCEVGVVSVSQISTRFIFIEAASSCKVLANMLLAGRREGEAGRTGLLTEGAGVFPTCWDAAASSGDGAPGEEREAASRQMAKLSFLLTRRASEDAGAEGGEKKVLSRYQVLRGQGLKTAG